MGSVELLTGGCLDKMVFSVLFDLTFLFSEIDGSSESSSTLMKCVPELTSTVSIVPSDNNQTNTGSGSDQRGREEGESDTPSTSCCSRRGRFTLELVDRDGQLHQNADQLAVTHANCDPSLSPVPTKSVVVDALLPRKVVRKVGRFVIEEFLGSSNASTDAGIDLPATHRVGRFEVMTVNGPTGSVTPTLMVYPVLER